MNQNVALIAQLLKGNSAESVAMNLLKQMPINDPVVTQLISYAKTGDNTNFLNLATNFFQQRGLNIDNEFSSFLSMLK